MIGDIPQPVVAEYELLAAARNVVAVNGVSVGFAIVGGEENRLGIGSRELILGLHGGLVLNDAQRAPAGIEQIEARVLFAFAIASHHQPFAVRGDVDELSSCLRRR